MSRSARAARHVVITCHLQSFLCEPDSRRQQSAYTQNTEEYKSHSANDGKFAAFQTENISIEDAGRVTFYSVSTKTLE